MKAVWTLPDCEKRLEEIIDTVADGTVTVNQQGLITTFNSAAEKFLEKKGSYLTLPSIAFLPTFVGIQTIHKQLIKKSWVHAHSWRWKPDVSRICRSYAAKTKVL